MGTPKEGQSDGDATRAKRGRKRDEARDVDILVATLDVLAEVGYAGLTMDAVAARARAGKATVYRRWASKEALLIDAITHMKAQMVDRDHLPNTGALRSDLIAMIKPKSLAEEEYRLRVMGGLASVLAYEPALADLVSTAVNGPWVDVNRILIRRAIDRGEFPETPDVEVLTQVIPSMAAYRMLIQRRAVDRAFIISLIDGILLPALRSGQSNPADSPDSADPAAP